MSGFFSLGGGGGKDHHQNQDHPELGVGGNNNNNNNLYLFKNEEIYSKGFELWQQYYHMHHHHRAHHNHLVDFSVGVGPSNAAAVIGGAGGAGSSSSSGNLVGDDEQNQGPSFRVLRPGGAAPAGGGGGVNCQDCGNQAKKDCSHLRCRTCCKSRGFQCQTHVKSTWVSAAKRRERQQQLFSLHHHQQQQQHELSLRGGGENPKRQRDSSSPLACTRIPTTSTGLEVGGHFPGEVNSPAVFRCVKVSAMDDDVDQYAYQTAVSIGGHVFKGILYDQGPETRYNTGHESSSAAPQQPLNLIAGAGAGSHQQAAATTMIDPSMYPTPFSAFMAGTQFFPPPRP